MSRSAQAGQGVIEKTDAEILLVKNLETVLKKDGVHKKTDEPNLKRQEHSGDGVLPDDVSSGPLVFNLDQDDGNAAKKVRRHLQLTMTFRSKNWQLLTAFH